MIDLPVDSASPGTPGSEGLSNVRNNKTFGLFRTGLSSLTEGIIFLNHIKRHDSSNCRTTFHISTGVN